jgi:hypothetical protein
MQTFPLNALAEQFECDRSTMVRAMRDAPADLVKPGNRPTWKVGTAARALEAHRKKAWEEKRQKAEAQRRKHEARNGGASGPTHLLADRLEQGFGEFDASFAKLEAERSLARRRKLDKELGVGKMIGDLDRQIREANTALGEGEDGMFAFVGDHLIGDLISNYLTLLDYWPDDAEMESLQAEGAARLAART